jgi:hypothetical protein
LTRKLCDWCGKKKKLIKVLSPRFFEKWQILYLCGDCAERFLRFREQNEEKIIKILESGILEDY